MGRGVEVVGGRVARNGAGGDKYNGRLRLGAAVRVRPPNAGGCRDLTFTVRGVGSPLYPSNLPFISDRVVTAMDLRP